MAGSFVVHGVLLNSGYAELPNLFRPQDEAAEYSHLMLIAHVIMAGAFVWIYQRGAENKAWAAQGIRFGVAIALLAPVPMYTIYYVVQPLPARLVVGQAVLDGLLVIVLALITAYSYRPQALAGTPAD